MKRKLIILLLCIGILILSLACIAGFFARKTRQESRDLFLEEITARNAELNIDVTVNAHNISETDFFSYLHQHLEYLCELYPEAAISCSIDGESSLDGFARIELDNGIHYLYLGRQETAYELTGNMPMDQWNSYLYNLFGTSGLQPDGQVVSENIMLFMLYNNEFSGEPGYRITFYYDFIEANLVNKKILSHQHNSDGFTLKVQTGEWPEESIEEVSMCKLEVLPDFETAEEQRDYFLSKHPDMTYYYVYPPKDENDGSEAYYIMENDVAYIYFTYTGQAYKLIDKGVDTPHSNLAWTFFWDAGYNYREEFTWEKDENSILWQNFTDRIFSLECDIGTGETFLFKLAPPADAQPVEYELFGTLEYGETLDVEVYRKGENTPFQVFQTSCLEYDGHPIYLEDFNADGYLDLTVRFYYGANGGTAAHYLWSPSKEQFVECSDELSYYGMYSIDQENRRLYMHYHNSALAGSEFTYQWENETDFSLIKSLDYYPVTNADETQEMQYQVKCYEGNEEHILADYTSPYEYGEDGNPWGLYHDELIWEETVTSSITGLPYHLYYAEKPQQDENGEVLPNAYEGHLYVVDRELCLIKCHKLQSAALSTEISLENQAGEDGQKLMIQYADGEMKEYNLSEIIEGF